LLKSTGYDRCTIGNRRRKAMSVVEERVEKLAMEIVDMQEKLGAILQFQGKIGEIVTDLYFLWVRDFVCADPHATWDGHLPGAYSEGDQIKTVLESKGHNVNMKRHPVTKHDFLTNLQNKYIVHLAGHGGVSGGQVKFCFDDVDVYPSDISALSSVPRRLFYAGTCKSGYNDSMASAFREKGTDYYVGFTENIPDWGAKYFGDLVYEKWLVDGKDLRTALDEADDSYPALSCWVLWD
jgi:hypothetical protein